MLHMPLIITTLLFSLLACAAGQEKNFSYPEHWWAKIEDPAKPNWEILPHEAADGEVILSKRNELGILSNFAATPFEYKGQPYASVEGFWQMMKFPEDKKDPRTSMAQWPHSRTEVSAMTAFEAKRAGDFASKVMKNEKLDWVSFEGERFPYKAKRPGRHYQLIVDAMCAKIDQNPEVRRILLQTGDLILRPDHHQGSDVPPEWRYHEVWMQIRDALFGKAANPCSPRL